MTMHDVLPQVYHSATWNFVTQDVLQAEGIRTERGYAEEGALRPAKITWTFNNATDAYRPTNPASVLYDGKGGRNIAVAVATDGSVRAAAEASQWEPDQTPDFAVGPPARGRRWVALQAEGMLRRIGQWNDPLRSAMYRRISTYTTLVGYFPLEDPATATRMTNAMTNGRPGLYSGVTLQGGAGPAGSDSVVETTPTSNMSGSFRSASSTAGFQLAWSCRLATLPPVGHQAMMVWTTSNGYRYEWLVDSGSYRLTITLGETVVKDATIGHGTGGEPNQWMTFRVRVSYSLGTTSVAVSWYPQGGALIYSALETFAGIPGTLATWQQPGNTHFDGALFAHVFGVTGLTNDLLDFGSLRSFDGYVGERAGDRFTRLCDELAITRELRGDAAGTMPMGRQRPDTFIELLKEIQWTEDGLIFDERDYLELVFRTRRSRYNQAAALALTFPTHVAPPLTETIDDQNLGNRLTAKQVAGGEAVAALTTGPMGLGPGGVGEYRRTVEVNLAYEDDLPDVARWWLARSTVRAPRYPTVVVDLDAQPGLTAQVNAVEPGDRITLTGREPDPLSMYVIGISETIQRARRVVTYTCQPDAAFTVGVYDATTTRYDSASTTLAAPATAGAGTLALTTVDPRDVWSTTPGYQLQLAGERVTVTAMTAAAGTGPFTQTATVTRAANGVVKAQTTGTAVSLADPVRYAL